VELASLIRQAVEISQPLVSSKEQHLEIELPARRVCLDADPVRLVQVFANLLNNASKYSPQQATIRLAAWEYPDEDSLKALAIFDEPLPESFGNEEEIIDLLHKYGEPAATAITGGKYFGFVCGSSIPVTIASRWMADAWDQNNGLYVLSPIASKLEEICEKWIVKLLGLPEQTAAGFVSGSSIASICCLTIARNELLKKQGWEVNEKGLFGAPEIRVVVGEQAHSSIFKALSIIGLGNKRIECVPVDEAGRTAHTSAALSQRALAPGRRIPLRWLPSWAH
jgi:hypothetical protein